MGITGFKKDTEKKTIWTFIFSNKQLSSPVQVKLQTDTERSLFFFATPHVANLF